jgi:DNA-binding CsgD family transcriptional regulator
LTTDRRRAALLSLQATEDMIRAGHAEDARDLTESVVDEAVEPDLIAEAKRMRGLLLIRSGSLTLGHDLLIEAADLIADDDPGTAARALLEATIRDRVTADYEGHASLALRARELAAGADPPDEHAIAMAELQSAMVGVALGEGDAAAEEIEARESAILAPERRLAVELNVGPVHAAVWAERYEWADRVLTRLIELARSRSTPTEMTYPLCVAAQLEVRRGRFELARAHADEAVRMALDTRQLVLASVGLSTLADIDASLGNRDACMAHFDRVHELIGVLGVDPDRLRDRAGGLLALIEGEPELAVGPLEAVEESDLERGTREPRILQSSANLIEARVWVGDEDGARRTLDWLEAAETATGGAWTVGAAARGRALLGPDELLDEHFGASVAAFDRGQAPFERARSELLWGERLRRGRRRADARLPLRRALTVFERVACSPLAERARRELEATGESVARVTPERRDELTPQELRIGLRVAEGRTNPEVASELFISRKTVERHLSQIYRKLGIRSRTELARVLWPTGPPA